MPSKLLMFTAAAMSLVLLLLFFLFEAGHLLALDGLSGSIWSCVFEEDTLYAPSYSHEAFRQLKVGMTLGQLHDLVGDSLEESWHYDCTLSSDVCSAEMIFKDEKLTIVSATDGFESFPGIKVGASKGEVLISAGEPDVLSLAFSKSRADRSYRVRVVWVQRGRISRIISRFYVD